MYSQSNEDEFVLDYFINRYNIKDIHQPGMFDDFALLEIGANDGTTFSNSKLLIENGWKAYLLEPGCICGDLIMSHQGNQKVHIFNYGIGECDGMVSFWESGAHVLHGKDKGLVSTTNFKETLRWPHVEFEEREIQLVSFDNFYNHAERPGFDFISIDAEGQDWIILQQIDLNIVGCRCLCIEHNGDQSLIANYINYCLDFGFREALRNGENIIFVK